MQNNTNTTMITALVPIKSRHQCKTRLSEHLDAEQRLALVRSMLNHVINILGQHPLIGRIIVLTPERDQLHRGIEIAHDQGGDLNSSLAIAFDNLCADAADKVLILPADLACVSTADIDALLHSSRHCDVVIAPSSDGGGTNALLLPSACHFEPLFGNNSFRRHLQHFTRAGYRCGVVRTTGLGFDVDTAADLMDAPQMLLSCIQSGRSLAR